MENNYSYIPIRSPLTRGQEKMLSAVFVLFLYLCFVGLLPFGPRLPFELKDTGQGDSLQRLFYLIIAAIVFLITFLRNDWRLIKFIGVPILLSLGWTLVSVLWSNAPDITLRRSSFLVIVVVTIFASTGLLGPQKVFNLLFYTLFVLIVASLISGPIVPNAVHREGMRGAEELIGLWRGVFFHKNIAGAAAAFLFLLSVQQLIYGGMIKNNMHLWMALLCSIPMLFLAYSKTSLGLIIPSMFVSGIFYYFIVRRNILYRTLLAIGIIMFLLFLVCLGAYFNVLSILDDPGAITGRAELWTALFQMIPDAPFLGYGYGAVFDVAERTPLMSYTFGWVLRASHAHNGFLQVTAEQGFIGLIFAILAFIIMPLWRVIYSPNIPKEFLASALALMTFFVFNNITESSFMLKNMCQWVVYVVIVSTIYYYVNIDLFMRKIEMPKAPVSDAAQVMV